MNDLGYEFPQEVPVFGVLRDAVTVLSDTLSQIESLDPDADHEAYIALVPQVAQTVRMVIGAIESIQASVDAAAPGANLGDALAEFPERLIEYLLVAALARHYPAIGNSLHLMGLIEEESVTATPTPFHRPYLRQRLRWERLSQLVSDPVVLAQEVYAWKSDAFAFHALVAQLARLGTSLGVPAEIISPGLPFNPGFDPAAPSVDLDLIDRLRALRVPLLPLLSAGLGIEIYPVLRADGAAIEGFGVGIYVDPNLQAEIALSDELVLRFEVEGGAVSLPSILVLKGAGVSFADGIFGGGGADLMRAEATLRYAPTGPKRVLVGIPRSTRLEADATELHLGLAGGPANPEVFVAGRLEDAALVLEPGEGDGFLQALLPSDGLVVTFDFTAGFSSGRGFYLDGGAGLDTTIGLHLQLGPIALELLHLGLRVDGEGVALELSTTASAMLGPIQAAVERIGIRARVAFERGNLGPANLSVAFKPPNGLGLAIDAGPVSGGGFISLDPDNGRYAGILQLSIYSVAVTAIGLLDTKGSDGQPLPAPGFSFLIIISAEFPPIQLGYGFTLNGVGGLAGIHRMLVIEALQAGIRNGSVDHILFPEDPIRDAPQIISDLRAIFPPTPNRFVFGPMAIIGWGSPTLIEGEIGIILEVPAPIRLVLLGQLNVVLPEPDAAVVVLHIDILGVLDFGRQLLSIDSTLRDSRIAAFAISGDMALRLSWGEKPTFAASVGGLNPHFQPPPDFPVLRRAMISFGFEDNPRIGVQAYMAVTSNSVQFGAQAELYYAAAGFNIHGWLLFDALVTFNPFFFRFDYSQGFALRRGDDPFLGLHVTGTLTGPDPYHLWGEGCISILFWDLCIRYDVEIGERTPVELPPKDPWPLLEAAINDVRNWNAALPDGLYAGVGLKKPAGDQAPLLVHPMGSVTLRQKVLPLNRPLDKFGEFQIEGANQYTIDGVQIGDEPAGHWEPVRDFFAPGQFENLSEAEKLSRDSFEEMDAGLTVASLRVEYGAPRTRMLEYETRIVDSPWDSRGAPPSYRPPSVSEQLALSERGAKAVSAIGHTGTLKYAPAADQPPIFALDEEEYAVAGTADLTVQREFGTARTKGEAYRKLKAHFAVHPEDRDRLQVVSLRELRVAA
ncbi:MAG: hypothetical protein JXA69_17935 [Phycisphaerae bacterium]|nr:hypothetical protein [Phycisphaerae bacterium]